MHLKLLKLRNQMFKGKCVSMCVLVFSSEMLLLKGLRDKARLFIPIAMGKPYTDLGF